jgi:hypothetical protein
MSEEMNTSSQVTGESGDLPVIKQTTADDLLSMYDQEVVSAKEEVDKEVDKQAKIQEELPKKIIANKVLKDLEQKEDSSTKLMGEAEAPKEPAEKAEEEQNGEESEEQSEEEQKGLQVKAFKAKLGDKELDIPEDAEIPVKVNNKDFSLKVKDAVTAFVKQDEFNRNMHRRISVVDSKEKKLQAEYSSINDKARQVVEMVQSGDFLNSIKSLAKVAGIDSESDQVALEKAFFNQLGELNKVWGEMNPQQREVYFAKREAEELKKRLDVTKQQSERARLEQELVREVDDLCKQHQISMEDFNGYYRTLAEELVGEGKQWANVHEIQPADVINYHRQVGTMKAIHEALAEEKSSEMYDSYSEAMDNIAVMSLEQGLDKQQIKELTKDIVKAIKSKQPNKAAENLNRKVAKSGQTQQLNPANSANKKNVKIEGYDDPADLEWLNRRAPRTSQRAF